MKTPAPLPIPTCLTNSIHMRSLGGTLPMGVDERLALTHHADSDKGLVDLHRLGVHLQTVSFSKRKGFYRAVFRTKSDKEVNDPSISSIRRKTFRVFEGLERVDIRKCI